MRTIRHIIWQCPGRRLILEEDVPEAKHHLQDLIAAGERIAQEIQQELRQLEKKT